MFGRVLIANRGEIVTRIASTLRRLGCSPAGVHVRDDPARSPLRVCDATVEIPSYLDVGAIIDAARRVGAQAVHPGYGFLSERADLARSCEAAGLAWVGPPAAAIELMGDKSAAREAAVRAGVPVLPGVDAPTPAVVATFVREHGLPVLIKAAAGGGGKGMRLVESLDELESALDAARREAAAAFGDGSLLVERYIAPARHLELQLLADAHGTVLGLGERECSLQRRHQKLVEETPSPAVDAALRATLTREAVALARACAHRGAGTVEFVAHAEDPARHYFLEMNTRLQVEHRVTEAVHGLDLVEWQLRVAAGERLDPAMSDRMPVGHAVEARVYAEDAARGFLPAAGVVRALALPQGPDVQVDAGIEAGESIGTRYDPMIAKLVAHGATRAQALARLRVALAGTVVLGVRSNVGFLRDLLDDPRVQDGRLDTALLEGIAVGGGDRVRAAQVALLADRRRDDGDVFARLRDWRLGGRGEPVRHRLLVDGEEVEVALVDAELLAEQPLDGGRALQIAFDGVSEQWSVARDGDRWWVGHDGHAWLVAPGARQRGADGAGEDELRAPMPGSVVAVTATPGAAVARGEVLLVLESMKMELEITAPRDGIVAAVHVAAGDQVALDTPLASMVAA